MASSFPAALKVLAEQKRLLADGSTELTTYADVPDPGGAGAKVQQTAVTDFRGKTIVTTVDVSNRLATKVLPAVNVADMDPTATYSYTPGGQLSQVQTGTNGAE